MQRLFTHFPPTRNGVEKTFYGSRIPMCLVDRYGNYIETNAAFAGFFGYTPQEIIGKSFRNYTHPDDLEGDNAALNDLLNRKNGQEHYEMDKRYLHKMDSHEVWFRLIVDAIWEHDAPSNSDRFSHFFVVAIPYPNGGTRFKKDTDDSGRTIIRPSISLVELAKDNKPLIILIILVLALLHPNIMALLKALLKVP